MNFFVQSTPAPVPASQNTRIVSLAAVAIIILMVVAQLFEYEDFPAVVGDFFLPGGLTTTYLLAALLVSAEVLALPFLLMMRLSPAMRVVSMVSGWLVVAVWLGVSIWINLIDGVGSGGMLGSTIPILVGWWLPCWFGALGVLVGWASWGMWPLRRRSRD